MDRLSNGVYVYSESYLKKKTKQELIEYIRIIEQNWINAEETNSVQYENCKRLLAEERNKTIDDFVKLYNKSLTVENEYGEKRPISIDEIAKQLKEM